MSLYLSEKLGRQRHGFEYGALEVKDHLEGLIFSEVVSTVMIMLVSILFIFAQLFFLKLCITFSVLFYILVYFLFIFGEIN